MELFPRAATTQAVCAVSYRYALGEPLAFLCSPQTRQLLSSEVPRCVPDPKPHFYSPLCPLGLPTVCPRVGPSHLMALLAAPLTVP